MDQTTGEDGQQPVLELRRLCKSFGGLKAVHDVSLRVMAGDRKAIVALIGLLLKQSAACGTTAGQH